MTAAWLLILFLFMAVFAEQGTDRGPTPAKLGWIGVGLCLLVAAGMPHPGLAILVALNGVNLWRFQQRSEKVHTALYPVCAYGGAYLALTSVLARELVPVVLWGFVGIGSLMGLWAIYAMIYYQDGKGFMHHYSLRGRHLLTLHEPNRDHGFECGQGNPNHAQAMAALCTAAGLGLVGMGQWGAAILFPLLVLPILGIQLHCRGKHPTQGPFHLMNLGVFSLPVLWPAWGGWAAGGYLVVLVLIAQPWKQRTEKWLDSGRIKYWKQMVRLYWWEQPWTVKVVGCGTTAWMATIYTHAKIHWKQTQEKQLLMTSAHNEFLHVFIEHGVIGLGALSWFLWDTLTRLAHAGPEGMAVYFLGVTLCSIATISFPWTFYHEVYLEEQRTVRGHGAPGLQAASLVIAVLAEVVSR
jgi:hypothetical protein